MWGVGLRYEVLSGFRYWVVQSWGQGMSQSPVTSCDKVTGPRSVQKLVLGCPLGLLLDLQNVVREDHCDREWYAWTESRLVGDYSSGK